MLSVSAHYSRKIRYFIAGTSIVFIIIGCSATSKSKLFINDYNSYEKVKLGDSTNCPAERQKDYFKKVRMKIASKWKYPHDIEKQYSQRTSTIYFTVNRSGDVLDTNILESSGINILDDAAVQAIKDASPVEMIPDCIDSTVTTLKIRGKFVYRAGAKKEIEE